MNESHAALTLEPVPPGYEASSTNRLDPKVWRVAAVVFLGPFMTQMDSTVVNVSLSTIGRELHSTIESAQWIISGYLLALALMLPLNGWLVDRLGQSGFTWGASRHSRLHRFSAVPQRQWISLFVPE